MLTVPQVFQGSDYWCWAACTQMILSALRNSATDQCEIVNRQFKQTTCCQQPHSDACNQDLSIYEVFPCYNSWGINGALVGNALQFETLQSEIAGGRPVEVGFSWSGAGGYHVAIAWRTSVDNIGPVVFVNDPQYGSGSVYYVNLLSAYGLGSWQWTWVSIQ